MLLLAAIFAGSAAIANPPTTSGQEDSIERLIERASTGDEAAWDAITRRLSAEDTTSRDSSRIIESMLNNGPDSVYVDLLRQCERWSRASDETAPWRLQIVLYVSGLSPTDERLSNPLAYSAAMDLYHAVLTADWISIEFLPRFAHTLQNTPLEPQDKSRLAVVSLSRLADRRFPIGSPFVDMLTPADKQRLRRALQSADLATPAEYPIAAAVALADSGDQSISELLEQHLDVASSRVGATDISAERKARWRTVQSALTYSTGMLAAQSSEQFLLEAISNIDSDLTLRLWAIERAVELGIRPTQIRTHVLRFAEAVDAELQEFPRDGRSQLRAVRLGPVKDVATKFDLLTAHDLSNVATYRRTHEEEG